MADPVARTQVRRGEVWRTDPDGSWRVVGTVEPGRRESRDQAAVRVLAALGIDPGELLEPLSTGDLS
jgi:hypothetical protein